jgi:hypothetical protein
VSHRSFEVINVIFCWQQPHKNGSRWLQTAWATLFFCPKMTVVIGTFWYPAGGGRSWKIRLREKIYCFSIKNICKKENYLAPLPHCFTNKNIEL